MLSEIDVMKSLKPHPHFVRLIGIKKGTGLLISVCWSLYTMNGPIPHCNNVRGLESRLFEKLRYSYEDQLNLRIFTKYRSI